MSGVVSNDDCLYCFPFVHNQILKFNTNDDTTIFGGDEIEGSYLSLLERLKQRMDIYTVYLVMPVVSESLMLLLKMLHLLAMIMKVNIYRWVVSKGWMIICTVFRMNMINGLKWTSQRNDIFGWWRFIQIWR